MSNKKNRSDQPDGIHVHGPHCGCESHEAGHAHARELPDFPTEIIFKAVFRNIPFVRESIVQLCAESGIDAAVTERASRNSTFISYTVTAIFPSDEVLRVLCRKIGEIEGFLMMF